MRTLHFINDGGTHVDRADQRLSYLGTKRKVNVRVKNGLIRRLVNLNGKKRQNKVPDHKQTRNRRGWRIIFLIWSDGHSHN